MKKTIISLLQELRSYIIILCCFVLISFIACFFVKTQLYDIITRPLHIVLHKTLFLNMEVNIEQLFIYTSIWENFTADIWLCLYFSLLFALPVLMVLLYRFIAKSLYHDEKVIVRTMFIVSFGLTIIAVSFCYFFLIPKAFEFFLSMHTIAKPMLKISDYISMIFHIIFGVGLAFQFPLLLILMTKFGLVEKNCLSKNRKIAIIIIFIVAAIITPPDVFSQIIVAIIFIALYELTNFIVVKLANNYKHNSYTQESNKLTKSCKRKHRDMKIIKKAKKSTINKKIKNRKA